MNDSSDDEIIPMKFSAITNALLNDESLLPPSSPATRKASHASPAYSNSSRHIRGASAGLVEARGREATASPETRANSPFPKRVIRFSGTPGSSTLRKRTSLSGAVRKYNEQAAARSESPSDVSTPAHGHGSVRIPITSSVGHGRSTGSSGRLSHRSGSVMYSKEADGSNPEEPATISRAQAAINYGSVSRYGLSTIGRARYGEDTGVMASSMRTKCVVKEDAKFMRGPARRGRRRQSDEDQEPEQENEGAQDAGFSSQEPQSQDLEPQPVSQETAPSSFYDSQHRDLAPSSPMRASQASKYNMQSSPSPVAYATLSQLAPEPARHASPPRPQPEQPVFRIPAPRPDRPELPSAHDQENEAPPTFKRNKPVPFTLLDKIDKVATRSQSQDLGVSRAALSPPRNVLAPRSHNTPHRPAPPPPPRMSVLETATATAGAATTAHASKKRNNIRVNGKAFTRLDIIGRGGSSKVWRVMAENGKFFALKRVNLEDADESAVRGYKGEIDLLSKLKGNDRVVSMLDYEMNDDKQTLSVVSGIPNLDKVVC
jgi:serine/threonine-protein kinase TTK/MPS1